MCGIAGLVRLDGRAADAAAVERMIAPIRHRGPDAEGVITAGPTGLGHVRLSIIDLEGGKQPMATPDERVCVTFNGEIFDHVELRAELERLGHRFLTTSDTEVLLHAYLEWGHDCVRRFNGQWAFAIWDGRTRELFLSRDRLGVRPLFWTRAAGKLLFASEVKALFADPDVTRAIDVVGLDQIFTFWHTVPPRTVFEGVHELPPGSSMLVKDGDVRVWSHFQPDYSDVDESASEEELAEKLRDLLVDATRLRLMRADVPVGAYLSGGLDSSVICGIVRRFAPDVHLKTFSVTFEDAEFDESGYQREVIDYLGVDHHQVLCRKDDIARSFPDVVWHMERPVVRTAPAPLFMLSRLVREHGYKVVLTGEGSDELLGGYDIFKEAKVRRFWAKMPESQMRPLLLKKLYPYMPAMQAQSRAYLEAFFFVRSEDLASPFFSHLPRWELTAKGKLFFASDVKAKLTGRDTHRDVASELPPAFSRWGDFQKAQYLETRYLLPGYILSSQGDRPAMAHAVEGRFPFLDWRVAELASRIPARLKMRALDEKYLLKRAAGDLVPPFLRKRPKQPYRAPDAASFFDGETGRARAPWIDELLSERRIADNGIFDAKTVRRLADKARAGKVIGVKDSMALVGVISTELVASQLVNGLGRMFDGS